MSQLQKFVSALLLATCLFIRPGTAHAYRPFVGTDGDVADLGEFELELGPVQLLRAEGHNYLQTPATVLNLGIMPRVELVVDFVGTAPLRAQNGEPRYEVGDTDVFLKILLRKGALQDEGGLSIALEAGPLLPEINGARGYGAAANLILSERWGWFIAHLNNTLELARQHLAPAWSNSLIAEFKFNETIWPVTELLWAREFRGGASEYSALAGVIWSVTDGFDLDAAAIVSSIDKTSSFEGRLGFTWAFQVWEPAQHSGDHNEDEKEKIASR